MGLQMKDSSAQFLFSALSPEKEGMVTFLVLNHFEGWSSNCQSRTIGFVSTPARDRLPTLQAFDQGQSFSTEIAKPQSPLSPQRVQEWPKVRDSAPSRSLLLSDRREGGSPLKPVCAQLAFWCFPHYLCECLCWDFLSNYQLILLVIESNSLYDSS